MTAPASQLEPPKAASPAPWREPLLLVDVVEPGETAHQRQGLSRMAWMGAIAALFLPLLASMLVDFSPSGFMWVTMVCAVAGIAAAETFNWKPASWFAAVGATAWASYATFLWVEAPDGPWGSAFLLVIGLAGLWHMRRVPAAGATLLCGAGLIAAYAAFNTGAAGPYGATLAALSAAAAIAGGSMRKLEPALGFGWLLACVGLFVLAGQPAAEPWFVPAFVLFATLFFAIEALSLPVIGRGGVMVAAIGALSPLMAIHVLYGAGLGANGRAGEALAYLGAAALQGLVLLLCARRLKDLKELSFAIAPAGVAIVFALVASSVIGLVEEWSAAALAVAAMAFARLHQRAPHRMWAAASIILMLAAIVQAAQATWILAGGAKSFAALELIVLGLGVPALAFAFAARSGKTPAPIMHAIYESLAITLGVAALAGLVRWIGTGGEPTLASVGFAEAGAHAAIWLTAAGLLLLCPERGVQDVRRTAARTLLALGATALAFGGFAWINPWWGDHPTPATGVAFFNTLAIGYLAPAGAIGGLVWLARRREAHGLAVAATVAAGACVLAWLALELRRDFHGAEIDGAGVLGPENAWLSMLLLAAALGLYHSRRFLNATERASAILLAATILTKVALIDLYQPADGWRVGSLVLLALAGVALAAPRSEGSPPPATKEAKPNPALWSVFHRLAACA